MANTIASKKQSKNSSVAFRRSAVRRVEELSRYIPSMGYQNKKGHIVLPSKERFL